PPSTHLEPAPAHPAAHHPSSHTRARTRNPQQTQAKSQARTSTQGQRQQGRGPTPTPPPSPHSLQAAVYRPQPGRSPDTHTLRTGPDKQQTPPQKGTTHHRGGPSGGH